MRWSDSRQHCSFSFFNLFPGKVRGNGREKIWKYAWWFACKKMFIPIFDSTVSFLPLHELSHVKADLTVTLACHVLFRVSTVQI